MFQCNFGLPVNGYKLTHIHQLSHVPGKLTVLLGAMFVRRLLQPRISISRKIWTPFSGADIEILFLIVLELDCLRIAHRIIETFCLEESTNFRNYDMTKLR